MFGSGPVNHRTTLRSSEGRPLMSARSLIIIHAIAFREPGYVAVDGRAIFNKILYAAFGMARARLRQPRKACGLFGQCASRCQHSSTGR